MATSPTYNFRKYPETHTFDDMVKNSYAIWPELPLEVVGMSNTAEKSKKMDEPLSKAALTLRKAVRVEGGHRRTTENEGNG